jgi:mRNA interferase RelE/StbE
MISQVFFSKLALQDLKKLPRSVAKRIMAKIAEMEEHLDQLDVKRLAGQRAFRLRVGDYRVIFDLDPPTTSINILKVAHRSVIYKR